MIATSTLQEDLKQQGFSVFPGVIPDDIITSIAVLMRDRTERGGRRNVLSDFEEVSSVAQLDGVRSLVEPVLGPNAFAVRGLFFDKTPGANWMVDWHQDRTIAACERREAQGFDLWTMKAGIHHVQPPVSVLEQMVTVRLHLDDTDESNGALRVIPGSHQNGFIQQDTIDSLVKKHAALTCSVHRGGALIMRPLVLHASSKAVKPGHRRVLHLEFASQPLPHGLKWAFQF